MNITEKLEANLTPLLEDLGYEIVLLEMQNHAPRTVRLFIDTLKLESGGIGIQDCAKVSKAVDEPIEHFSQNDELLSATEKAWFQAGYELEVSSPGIDRPLRKPKDFIKFIGRETRLQTLRPLSEIELKNSEYFKRNPKQKNYFGEIAGFEEGGILLKVSASMGSLKTTAKPGAKISAKKKALTEKIDLIVIPLQWVAKANLEPDFSDDNIEEYIEENLEDSTQTEGESQNERN